MPLRAKGRGERRQALSRLGTQRTGARAALRLEPEPWELVSNG